MAAYDNNWLEALPGQDLSLAPAGLPSRPTNGIGFLPSGGGSGSNLSTGGGGGNVDWAKLLTTGAGLATSAFAGNSGSITPDARNIQGNAQQQLEQGKQQFAQGQADIGPVLKYFKALASGDSASVLAATQPERARVTDQYDSARRSAAQFTPRGGGQASTQQESRAKEASDLGNITAGARKDALQGLTGIGLSEQQSGLSTEQAAQNSLAQVLSPLFNQEQSDTSSTIAQYAGYAALVASFL